MRGLLTVTFVLLFLFGRNGDLYAQHEALKFRHLSINEGLSQNMITAIAQDHRGIIWFGTRDGLNRYDGYSFTVYKANPGNLSSLSDNYITCIYEDDRQNLWVGTRLGGLNLYDAKKDAFVRINDTLFGKKTPSPVFIRGNSRQGLWITTAEGYIVGLRYNDHNPALPPLYLHTVLDKNKLGKGMPTSAIPDRRGTLWVATDKGLRCYDIASGHIDHSIADYPAYRISKTGALIPATSPSRTEIINASIKEDSVWLTTRRGIYQYLPQQREFRLYDTEIGDFNVVSEVVRNQKNETEIWISTFNKGLAVLNLHTGQRQDVSFTTLTGNPQHDGVLISLFGAKDGSVWIGSNGRGVWCYSENYSLFKNAAPLEKDFPELSSGSFYHVYPFADSTGKERLLFSTLTAFFHWNRTGNSLSANNRFLVRAAAAAQQHFLWFGTSDGLMKYNPYTEHEIVVDSTEKVITGLFVDAQQQIWYSTPDALRLYDPVTELVQVFRYSFSGEATQRSRASMYSVIYPDPDGSLWVGTVNGLFRFDPLQLRYTAHYRNEASDPHSISSNEINALLSDPMRPHRFLWIGTPAGLNCFDKETGRCIRFDTRDGLPNNTVYGILSDTQGNLWLSTNQGLSMFNPLKKTFTNFDVNNGLQSNEFNTGAYFKSDRGELFFGGINGFNRFYPEQIRIAENHVPLTVSWIEIPGADKEIVGQMLAANPVHLPHDRNNIHITLSSLEYSAPEKVRYAYRIYNQDSAWIHLGHNRQVTLTGLSPGRYVFQAKATDSFGRWKEDIAQLTFTILPPWYNSWWARSLYVLVGAALLYLLWVRYKRRSAQRIELENKRRQAASLLELDRVKSRFLANITHEFRTPLTLIAGHLEHLKTEESDEKTLQQYASIEQNSRHLLRLINQLMDLSRMESGAYRLRYKKAYLLADLKPGVFAFHSYAERKNIRFTLEIDPETETWLSQNELIYAPDAVDTIVKNLLSNACKFVNEGGFIRTTVACFPEERKFTITVSNSGPAIPPEDLPRLFDRFFQSDTTSIQAYEGSGIGLSLVKELAVLHGGQVAVTSSPAMGTSFSVVLREGEPDSAEITAVSEELIENQFQSGSHEPPADNSEELPLILIVEDHEELRRFIRESLGDGYRFVEAVNGKEGLRKATETVPDLLISDVMMPEMDGFALCHRLKNTETTSHIPLILLTARVMPQDKIEGLETGADDYLTKPFSPAELRLRVRNMIRSRRLLRERYAAHSPIQGVQTDPLLEPIEKVFLEKVAQTITANLSSPGFGVENLAQTLNMSSSQLNRKLKALTGQTTVSVINGQRMQRALELLQAGADNVSGVAFRVGFEDPGYFTRVFRRHFGFLPSDKDRLQTYGK